MSGQTTSRIFDTKIDKKTALKLFNEVVSGCVIPAPRRVDKSVWIYGAGNLGKMAAKFFERLQIAVSGVLDINPQLYVADVLWENTLLLEPENVSHSIMRNSLVVVAIANHPYIEIRNYLNHLGWTDVVPFYDVSEAYTRDYPLTNGWFTGQFTKPEISGAQVVIMNLSDSASLAHYLQFLAWHSLREEWIFTQHHVNTQNRYFIPEVIELMGPEDHLVDVGAHHGEVSVQFVKEALHGFQGISLVEADPANMAQAVKTLRHMGLGDRIQYYQECVYSRRGEQMFVGSLGYSSQLSLGCGSKIDTILLDDLRLKPTMIKFHLEGWELEALKGSLDTLRLYRPIVALTAYHNRLGISELAMWMMNNMDGYSFRIRMHSWCGTGLVIYAISK